MHELHGETELACDLRVAMSGTDAVGKLKGRVDGDREDRRSIVPMRWHDHDAAGRDIGEPFQ